MVYGEDGSLIPFNFNEVLEKIPEVSSLELKLTVLSFASPLDSSNLNGQHWKDLSYIIRDNYEQYDGFVILHGTDTMAYTASALSFMLEGLNKPVILTGAQIPIGHRRSDARENLITALEIASAKNDNKPIISEVCIYFNFVLLRGCRAQKVRSSTFAAFQSQNYPILAESGIFIEYNTSNISPWKDEKLTVNDNLDPNVTVLKIFPGIQEAVVRSTLQIPGLRGLVLESYGSGNTMDHSWFLDCLKETISRGVIVYNVSQCSGGEVIMGRYKSSKNLLDIGVVSGRDITTEAALAKMMLLLGSGMETDSVKEKLSLPIAGEMDI